MDAMRYALEKCINRNILECKAFKGEKMAKVTFSINRNILECKGKRFVKFTRLRRVLIETYWNVKEGKGTDRGWCDWY